MSYSKEFRENRTMKRFIKLCMALNTGLHKTCVYHIPMCLFFSNTSASSDCVFLFSLMDLSSLKGGLPWSTDIGPQMVPRSSQWIYSILRLYHHRSNMLYSRCNDILWLSFSEGTSSKLVKSDMNKDLFYLKLCQTLHVLYPKIVLRHLRTMPSINLLDWIILICSLICEF